MKRRGCFERRPGSLPAPPPPAGPADLPGERPTDLMSRLTPGGCLSSHRLRAARSAGTGHKTPLGGHTASSHKTGPAGGGGAGRRSIGTVDCRLSDGALCSCRVDRRRKPDV